MSCNCAALMPYFCSFLPWLFSIRGVCLYNGVCFLLSALAHPLYMDVDVHYSLISPTSYFFGLMSLAVSTISLLSSVNYIPAFPSGLLCCGSSHVLQNHFFLFLDSFLPPSLLHLATSVLLAGLHTLSPMALPSRMCTHLVLFNFRVWKIVSLAHLRFIIL